MSPEQKKRLYYLWALRENIAEKRTYLPLKYFSDSNIISLCQLKDCQTDSIAKVIGHRNAARYANKIQEALVEGDQWTEDPPQYKRTTVQRSMVRILLSTNSKNGEATKTVPIYE